MALSLNHCHIWTLYFFCCVVFGSLHERASCMFFLETVLGYVPFAFVDCASDICRGDESLSASPSAVRLNCHLCCFASLLILLNAHVFWYLVNLY